MRAPDLIGAGDLDETDDLSGALEVCRRALERRPGALFCDIDGTLSPLAETPERARVLPRARSALNQLVSKIDLVCLLSGRPADDAWRMVQVDDALYVGNHGAESWIRGQLLRPAGIERYAGRLGRASDALRVALADVPGLVFEDKGIGLAIHYRRDPSAELTVLRAAERFARRRGLQVIVRSSHVEVRAPVPGDKGTALRDLAERHALRGLVVIGDDPVDAPAFEAARDYAKRARATAVTVTVGDRGPGGDLAVPDVPGVADLLLAVARALS